MPFLYAVQHEFKLMEAVSPCFSMWHELQDINLFQFGTLISHIGEVVEHSFKTNYIIAAHNKRRAFNTADG